MKEEEVDQYFKNKFCQFAPPPPADGWARLQPKLEAPVARRPGGWVYYAAAAITLLLLSGVLFFWAGTNQERQTGNLARQSPVGSPVKIPPANPVRVAPGRERINPAPLAGADPDRADTNLPGKPRIETITDHKPVKKSRRSRPGRLPAALPKPGTDPEKSSPPIAGIYKLPEGTGNPAAQTLAARPPAETQVMEVIIKKDAPEPLAEPTIREFETPSAALRDKLGRKGKLVKNILKQARNLKNGEKVEWSTLGVSANYRIGIESKILKHKYSKVINL